VQCLPATSTTTEDTLEVSKITTCSYVSALNEHSQHSSYYMQQRRSQVEGAGVVCRNDALP